MKVIKAFIVAVCLGFSLLASAGQVNINTADVSALTQELQGVGKSRAEAIVAYRKKNGPFKSIEELSEVDGIGVRTVEKNRASIILK